MSETLTNRIALVTGGGRGIGHAISLGLAEHGARVAVLARSAGQVHKTARRITGRGGQALALPADVADLMVALLRGIGMQLIATPAPRDVRAIIDETVRSTRNAFGAWPPL